MRFLRVSKRERAWSISVRARGFFLGSWREYLLNGVACRLKDITNLFLDTGIANNSYAIIELKMVDDLLNDKDNSRRALFEEAAGISKFKIRKKETLKKLNDTDDDLDRVEDLLFEIEKNLKSLERQAKQAKRYFEIKEEYKLASIALAHKTIQSLNEIHGNISRQIDTENDKKQGLNTQLTQLDTKVQELKADLISKEKLLGSRQRTLNEHVHKIRQYESDKKIRNERQRFLQDKIENLKEQVSQDKQSNERASFSIDSLGKEKETATKILSEIKHKLAHLEGEYEKQKDSTQQAEHEVNELSQKFSSHREQVYHEGKEIEIKEIQLSTARQELEKTSQDSSNTTANLEEFEDKLGEIEQEKGSKQAAFEQLKAEENKLSEHVATQQQHLDLLKQRQVQINRQLDAKQNEYGLTKSLVENLEGFPEAIKFLRKSEEFKRTPLLSDIIACPEEYRVCIENYLEPFMNHYVVDSHAQAQKAVALLSDSSRGKANFFLLDQLDAYQPEAAELVPGATPASEIVEYDEKYSRLIAYLLHNAFIYEEHLPSVSRDAHVSLIAKSGKITTRRFTVSGGSVGLFEGKKIGRAKNLEKLESEIKTLSKQQEKAHTEIIACELEITKKQGESQQDKVEILREEMSLLNEEFVSLRTKKEQFASMLSSNTNRREGLEEQISELQASLSELRPRYEVMSEGLSDLELQITNRREALGSMSELRSEKSAAYNAENVLFHQQESKVNAIEQEINFKNEAFQSSLDRIQKNLQELRAAEDDLHDLEKKTAINDDDLALMYEEKETIEQGVNEAEKEYYGIRGEIDQQEKGGREVQRQRETVDEVLLQWQSKLNETKMQLNSAKDRLSVEFGIDFDQLDEDVAPQYHDKSEADLKGTTERLKQRLDNMGPINPMAMEAYEEIKERYDFITSQKEDLLLAKESLLSTIGEIDMVAKETFLTAFEQIKENFIRVFRTLFTEEDDCDLRLTNPEDPLESSIDITAKPKGKRPLTINQLSGGEKTLTATSLLFAIYLIKPAPFCIFDEVDAPLDDANIDKFNNIIRKFSNDSQFIIVTHNKRTMASTDVIYGVTMVEQGISRVVPVDLRELA
ncbi:MAG: chromosome segregation protein SMC [Bacteroidota bacterium]